MSRWFRSYADKHRNPKVARLSDSDFRLWDQLLCVASENDGKIPPADDLKHLLNRRLDHLSCALKRLVDGRLIEALEDGYAPRNWNEKQYKSDSSTPRVQKFRAKGNVTGNVSETAPDTETDTEEKTSQKRAIPKGWKPEPFGADTEAGKIVASWPEGEFDRQFVRFCDHHRAKGSKFSDWQAAWGTWVRNSQHFTAGKPKPADAGNSAYLAQLAERTRLDDLAKQAGARA